MNYAGIEKDARRRDRSVNAHTIKISKKGLLKEALSKLHIDIDEVRAIRDNYGIVGYDIGEHILVAKPMLFNGYMVSCDKNKIIWNAIRLCKKILFYIQNHNVFYEFEPVQINAHPGSFVNRRRNIEMLNFSVGLGKKVSIVDIIHQQYKLCI